MVKRNSVQIGGVHLSRILGNNSAPQIPLQLKEGRTSSIINFVESAHYSIRFNFRFSFWLFLKIFSSLFVSYSILIWLFQALFLKSFNLLFKTRSTAFGIVSNNFNLNQVLTLSYDFCGYCEVYPIKINF